MPVDMKPSSRYSRFAGEMGFSLEVKSRSWPQETSTAETPKFLSSQPDQLLKSREKAKLGSPYSRPDYGHGLSPRTVGGRKLESRSKVNSEKPWIGIKGNKNELVKHMSDLPGYLQRFEKGESTQEKALNFGVLDWGSLEKWKQKKRISPGSTSVASSSSGKSLFKEKGPKTLSGTVQSKSLTPRRKQPQSVTVHSDVDSYHKYLSKDVKKSRGEVIPKESKHQLSYSCNVETSAQRLVTPTLKELQTPEHGQRICTRDHRQTVPNEDSPIKVSLLNLQTSNRSMIFDGKSMLVGSEISGEGSCCKAASAGLNPEVAPSFFLPGGLDTDSVLEKNKNSSFHGLSDYTPRSSWSSNGSPNKCMDANSACTEPPGENRLNSLEQMDYETTDPADMQRGLSSPSRLFSLSLGKVSRTLSFEESPGVEQLSSASDCIEPDIFSDCFSSDGHLSEESISGTIHPCDFPVGVETNTSFDMSGQSMDLSSTFSYPIDQADTPRSENARKVRRSWGLSQKANEQAAIPGRHPSPNHRFSFSLGRLTRSFSFKEGATVPMMNPSTSSCPNSGPVMLEVPGSLDKASSHSRGRSSPFRRMMDPLLKARVTSPSTGAPNSLTEKTNLTVEGMRSTTKAHEYKNKDSPIQALLQIRVKNGLPLFELVVEGNREILVAMRKPGKNDADLTYTLYSVSSTKKSGSIWMNHGKKGKSRPFDYTVVGQMKIFKPILPDSTEDQFTVRESVLYGFDSIQADHETPAFMPEMEGAAIIVKIPICDSSDDNKEVLFRDLFLEDGHYCRSLEVEKFSGSTTVVLPGGIHCSPNGELPSPLIERWKSGGSCDCGGWDLGCKLQVLTNDDDQPCNLPGPPQSFSSPNGFHLYSQGGGGCKSRPIFSLSPFKKGIYSVQFQKPVLLVQAFSICVAVISSHQCFDFLEEENEANLAGGFDRMRILTKFHGELPPPSPVGRV